MRGLGEKQQAMARRTDRLVIRHLMLKLGGVARFIELYRSIRKSRPNFSKDALHRSLNRLIQKGILAVEERRFKDSFYELGKRLSDKWGWIREVKPREEAINSYEVREPKPEEVRRRYVERLRKALLVRRYHDFKKYYTIRRTKSEEEAVELEAKLKDILGYRPPHRRWVEVRHVEGSDAEAP